uniref:Glyoxalase domain-containing protein 5 n=1 Tax=Oncorhynchus kisutch TaxID=8019 RepID=A0A8C7F8F6_ONCKI
MTLRTLGCHLGRFQGIYRQLQPRPCGLAVLGVRGLPVVSLGVRCKSSGPVQVSHLDHLVLTVKSVPDTCTFYSSVLGMEVITFKGNRKALCFGKQKLNLHQVGQEFEPKALRPTSGSADLCLITLTPLAAVATHLQVTHTHTHTHPCVTVLYIYPDHNLIEVSNYNQPTKD